MGKKVDTPSRHSFQTVFCRKFIKYYWARTSILWLKLISYHWYMDGFRNKNLDNYSIRISWQHFSKVTYNFSIHRLRGCIFHFSHKIILLVCGSWKISHIWNTQKLHSCNIFIAIWKFAQKYFLTFTLNARNADQSMA